ncbi:hypothetical protein MBBA_0112 [Methanoculleus bourgensis]|jgi:hypothetical protein|nr:hypothetical protein MBBA_0112 [Methanoculleus bourgensis]
MKATVFGLPIFWMACPEWRIPKIFGGVLS